MNSPKCSFKQLVTQIKQCKFKNQSEAGEKRMGKQGHGFLFTTSRLYIKR